VLVNVSEEATQAKQRRIREQYNLSIICKSNSTDAVILQTHDAMRALVVILDSSRHYLKNIAGQSESHRSSEKEFQKYQEYINRNIATLEKHSENALTTILSPYLGLNEKLLPEETRTKEKNAVILSTVLLEESLTSHVTKCMNKLAKNLTNCDKQQEIIAAQSSQ
jgi:hypothetical protein